MRKGSADSRRTGSRRSKRAELDAVLDDVFFLVAGVAAVWLAYLVLEQGFESGWGQVWFDLLFWLVLAYLALPRLHRILTRLYVPNYFIGRTRTSDGLLGDPVNLGFLGSEEQVHRTMVAAGWTRADDLTLRSGARIVRSTLLRRSYPQAPVSPLELFERQQDFAYEQQVHGDPAKRHHVRFWRCPPGWMLPGGIAVDWLAAGTNDRSVGLSLFTLQVTHKIDEDTDTERDHILATISAADPAVAVSVIRNFSTGYHARNGGGDAIETDGDLPIVDVREVPAPPAAGSPPTTDSRDRRPSPTVAGTVIVVARAIAGAISVVTVLAGWDVNIDAAAIRWSDLPPALTLGGSVLANALLAAAQLLLAGFIFRGHNGARIAILALSAISIGVHAIDVMHGGPHVTLQTDLLSVSLDILLLLALSSDRARTFAHRRAENEGHRKPVGSRRH